MSINRLEGQLSSLPDLMALQEKSDQWEAQHQARINTMIAEVEDIEFRVAQGEASLKAKTDTQNHAKQALKELGFESAIHQNNAAILKVQSDIQTLQMKCTGYENDINYYTHKDVCDVCMQYITKEFARERIDLAKPALASAKVLIAEHSEEYSRLVKNNDRLAADANVWKNEIQRLEREIAELSGEVRADNRALDRAIQNVKDAASEKTNPYTASIQESRDNQVRFEKDLKEAQSEYDKLQGQTTATEYWVKGFRKVRLFIVNRILAALEIEVSNAASALGLPNWHIEIKTEVETKTGGVKSGVHILVRSPNSDKPWVAWSGGEGQRIKLAVSIGLASLIHRMAGVSFNFEVWDEPTAWLSVEGIDDLLDCLQYRASSTQKSIWLLDHRVLGYGGFAETWCITKTARGSRMKLISRDT
jgi:predicted  nucleic acid-binding Zn-ribbon protein